MPSILIENGHILTVNGENDVYPHGYLLIDGDHIAAVAEGETPDEVSSQADEIINASGQIVMPGFVNSHVHLFQTLIRGLSDNRPLIPWLEEVAFPVYEQMTAQDVYLAVMVGAIENIRGGTTTVTDNFTVKQNSEGYDAVFRAAKDMSIRYKMARGYSDTGYPDALMETGEEIIASTKRLLETWCRDDDLLSIDFSPNVVWSTTQETLVRITELAHEWDVGIHIHVAEDDEENHMCLEENGVRQVKWLADLGVLGAKTQLAHAIWVNEEEINLLAESGTSIAHNPVSNMFIGTGVCPVIAYREAGVHVAIGTDGQACNNGQEMLDVLKWVANLHKVSNLDAQVLTPEKVIQMACRNGAYAFGQPDLIGSLEVGKKADVILVDMGNSRLTMPSLSVPSLLVNFARTEDVVTTIVDGKILMRDREILVLDEDVLVKEFKAVRSDLLGRVGIS